MADSSEFDPYALTDELIAAPPETLWKALRQIGPGIILAGSIVGSGELILTTALGADYGFGFLWLVLFSCVVKVFVQIELGRYTLSSGEPTLTALNKLPGWRFGAHWLVWWWFIMLLATVFQLGAMVGLVGMAMNLAFPRVSLMLAEQFPAIGEMIRAHPEHPWAILTALAATLLLLSGGYRRIERVTTVLVVSVTFITVACVLMLPGMGYPITLGDFGDGFSVRWLAALSDEDRMVAIGFAFSTFGITGVGASELYSYPYWCLEKGYGRLAGRANASPEWAARARGWMRVMYLDAWVSMIVFTVATVSFYMLGATVLHRQGLHPKGPEMIKTLAEMYVPAFGDWARVAFLIGAWAVLFKTLYVASASHSRLTADFLSLTRVVRHASGRDRMKWVRIGCVFFPMLALVLYFWQREPKGMVAFGGFFQAITLPVITGCALFLRYRRLDARLAPSKLFDVCLWVTFVLITACSLYSVYIAAAPLVRGWLNNS